MKGMLEEVRRARHMPWLKRGMLIDMNGKRYRVTGGNSQMNINAKPVDGGPVGRLHPWWQTTYYGENGEVIADYKK